MKIAVIASTLALALSGVEGPSPTAAQQALPVGKLSVVPSLSLGEIDTDVMKGQPAKLAWSPDGSELYLQLLEGDFGKNGAVHHVLYTLSDGRQRSLDVMPPWATTAWAKKSDRSSPDVPALQIGVDSAPRTERAASSPMGGDLARGGVGGGGDIGGGAGGTTAGEAIAGAANMQSVMVNSLKIGKEVIGEFINAVPVPGLTFGWGPAGSHVIVYSAPKTGKLFIMDTKGKKQEVDGTRDALLPALSPDATRLAWVRRDGRKKYSLIVANVTTR